MSVERWSHLLWLIFMVKAEHVESELNFTENLSFQFSCFRVTQLCYGAFFSMKLTTSHFLQEMHKASGNKQQLRGSADLLICLMLAVESLQASTTPQRACFLRWQKGHIHSIHIPQILSLGSHSGDKCREEHLFSGYMTSQPPQLISALFGFHSLKRQILNRKYILQVLSNY